MQENKSMGYTAIHYNILNLCCLENIMWTLEKSIQKNLTDHSITILHQKRLELKVLVNNESEICKYRKTAESYHTDKNVIKDSTIGQKIQISFLGKKQLFMDNKIKNFIRLQRSEIERVKKRGFQGKKEKGIVNILY